MSEQSLMPEHELLTQVAHARHELRTPVNALLGYCEMLLEDAASLPYPQFQAGLQEVQAVARQLNNAIGELLQPTHLDNPVRDLAALGALARRELRPHGEQILRLGGQLLAQAQKAPLSAFLSDLDRILAAAYRYLTILNDATTFTTGGATPELIHPSDAGPHPAEQESTILSESSEFLGECHGHILIVDDNPFNRDMLARGILAQKHHFALAGHGKQALEMLASHAFDLVLLDILMPEMDGFEVLARIKEDPALSSTPVIMITALDQIDSVVRCLEMGAVDYLPKPFDPTILRAKVEAALELKRLRDLEKALAGLAAATRERKTPSHADIEHLVDRRDALGDLARNLAK